MTARLRHHAGRRRSDPRSAADRSSATRSRSSWTAAEFLGLITRIDLINYLERIARTTIRSTERRNRLGFATRAIHAGQEPDPTTGAVMMPIYATSTYAQSSPGVHKGYEYSRTPEPDPRWRSSAAWPIWRAAPRGFAFASGLAAIATVLELLEQPAPMSSPATISTAARYRLFERVRRRSAGLEFSFVDLADLAALEAAITPEHAADLGRDADQSDAAGSPTWRAIAELRASAAS